MIWNGSPLPASSLHNMPVVAHDGPATAPDRLRSPRRPQSHPGAGKGDGTMETALKPRRRREPDDSEQKEVT